MWFNYGAQELLNCQENWMWFRQVMNTLQASIPTCKMGGLRWSLKSLLERTCYSSTYLTSPFIVLKTTAPLFYHGYIYHLTSSLLLFQENFNVLYIKKSLRELSKRSLPILENPYTIKKSQKNVASYKLPVTKMNKIWWSKSTAWWLYLTILYCIFEIC